MKKILFLSSFVTSGHRKAAEAIQESCKNLSPSVETSLIDLFEISNPFLRKIIATAYLTIIEKIPKLWDYLYDDERILKGTKNFRRFFYKLNAPKFQNLIAKFNAEVIVCTQALSCNVVAKLKEEYKISSFLIGIVTDFVPHCYWIHKAVDIYIVPNEKAKGYFVERGINPEKVFVLGIPVSFKFSQKHNKLTLKGKWHLDLKLPTLLIMGGGKSFASLEDVVRELNAYKDHFQLMVITGRNEMLKRRLEKLFISERLKIWGYISDIEEVMELADLIVTKPGGLNSSESLVKGLPMVLINLVPGQEKRNARYLMENGVAIEATKGRMGKQILDLLGNPLKLKRMRERAYALAKPNAALEGAKLIMKFL